MKLVQIKTALGDHKISVNDLFGDIKELVDKTGIENVYKADSSTIDLALKACNKIDIKDYKNRIKLCILVTQTPDDYLPANSIVLSEKLGLPKSSLAFDLNQGCSGYVQALCYVEKLLPYYGDILLVTADRYRDKLDNKDRSTNAVFSDGSSATLCAHDSDYGILYEDHMTDGSKRKLLFQSAQKTENNGCLHMSGAEVWMFTKIKVLPQIIKAIKYCKQKKYEISGIYMHQASKVVVEGIKNMLPIDNKIIHENYFKTGNTVSSTIPFLINDFPIINNNTVSIFAGFGVGLTSSVIIYGKR